MSLTWADFLASAGPDGDCRAEIMIYSETKTVFCYEYIGWEACVPSTRQEIVSWQAAAETILHARQFGDVTVRGLFSCSELEPRTLKFIRKQDDLKRLSHTRPQLSPDQYKKLKGALDEQFQSLKTWHNSRRKNVSA